MLPDQTVGNVLHFVSTGLFVYYTLWIIVSPFVDANHFTQMLFPSREFGVAIPAIIVVVVLLVSLTTVSLHIIAGRAHMKPPQHPPFATYTGTRSSNRGEPRRPAGVDPFAGPRASSGLDDESSSLDHAANTPRLAL